MVVVVVVMAVVVDAVHLRTNMVFPLRRFPSPGRRPLATCASSFDGFLWKTPALAM